MLLRRSKGIFGSLYRNTEVVLGLDSIKSLLGELGNPQKDLKFIHIAGTNGKGSILAGLSGILQQAGYEPEDTVLRRDGIYGTISG